MNPLELLHNRQVTIKIKQSAVNTTGSRGEGSSVWGRGRDEVGRREAVRSKRKGEVRSEDELRESRIFPLREGEKQNEQRCTARKWRVRRAGEKGGEEATGDTVKR